MRLAHMITRKAESMRIRVERHVQFSNCAIKKKTNENLGPHEGFYTWTRYTGMPQLRYGKVWPAVRTERMKSFGGHGNGGRHWHTQLHLSPMDHETSLHVQQRPSVLNFACLGIPA